MNTLYVIRFRLSNGYVIGQRSFWNHGAFIEKLLQNWKDGWKFSVIEKSDLHWIIDAR